ncbi:Centrosomal protein of 120 kDa [Pseudolycoriella hygida]|uniref:Centrosomal protein of 120 kDa n=1 Tax=Pseudolycoriella hygida TaxID=35572 RepID=A0A9Q0RU81_9DIPT|nr:Centrosomal protein of 120 kDa [Pseudolycoriella hygida]
MIILVYVVEASGLNYPNHKIIATASLGKNVLETKVSSPRNTTRFDSTLAWKTDMNSIKRMKADNIPIKVECYCVGKVEREMIGFVVVPLRSVAVLIGNKVVSITPKWHRLIGLRHSWKTLRPEILMFVTITDVVGVQIINEMRNTTSSATKNMLIPQQDIHVELNRKEQHIQIGDSALDCHRFTIEIYWHHCEWLSYLTENAATTDVSFQMKYTLLDCPTERRNLPKMYGTSDEERYMVHEKITIQLRSSLRMLRKYFENVFYIPIYIYCKDEMLGRAFFKISSALPDSMDLNDFLSLTKDGTFVAINESHIYPTKTAINFIDEEHRPILKYNLTLQYHEPSRENQLHQDISSKITETSKYLESRNQQSYQNVPSNPAKLKSSGDVEEMKYQEEIIPSTRRETVEQSIQKRNTLIQKLLQNQIDPPNSAKQMESMKFVEVDEPKQPQTCRRLQEPSIHHSPNRMTKDHTDHVSTPPVETDAYSRSPKTVSFNPQLEEDALAWKTKLQDNFAERLREKENERLESLAGEWFTRQKREEEKLASKMNKCRLLTEALENALTVIKEKDTISMDQRKLDEAAYLEQQKKFEEKISALTDQMRRTAIDHDYQLKLMEIKLKEMEMKKKFIDEENETLKMTIRKLEEQNELLRSRNIELDAVSNGKLQSIELKLKHSQELELFYKNKWQIAEQKLNENQSIRQGNVLYSNSQLRACVVDVLNSVRSDLEADKFELQSIKEMLE